MLFCTTLLFSALILLVVAFFSTGPKTYAIGAIALSIFVIFWWTIGTYLIANKVHVVNGVGAMAISLMPLIFIIQSHRTWKEKEEFEPLRWIYGLLGFTCLVYFTFERVPLLSASAIYIVTFFVLALLFLLGFTEYGFGRLQMEELFWSKEPLFSNATKLGLSGPGAVNIIMACTALSGLAGLGSAVMCTNADARRRYRVVLKILPILFVVNVIRILILVLILHFVPDSAIGELSMFDLVHHWIADVFIFAILYILLMASYRKIPELHMNIRHAILMLDFRSPPPWEEFRSTMALLMSDGEGLVNGV